MTILRVLTLAGLCGATACADGGATAPGGLPATYAGEWAGTTSQGSSIAFSVSAQNVVTSITIGRDFNGCRDAQAFSSLSLAIGDPDLPGRAPTPSTPGFGFGSGSPEAPDFVQVTGQFLSARAASGTVAFLNFESCGNAVAIWSAAKR